MFRKMMLVSVMTIVSTSVMAAGENNVGSCGWGSKLMEGNRGIAPQVFAATTNGTFGNQTFGITSGTSGCTQDGIVTSNWQLSLFIESNKNKLARDISRGHGETLEALAKLIGISSEHKPLFRVLVRENFAKLFNSKDITANDFIASLEQLLKSHSELGHYSSNLS